jgi:hypothetical protein
MTVSNYLCFVVGAQPERVRRSHASTQARTAAYGIALHIPVLIWCVTGYLIASQLFELQSTASAAVACGAAGLIYLVERLVIACPPGRIVTACRVAISVIAAILGASAVDLTIFQREIEQQLRADREREIVERHEQASIGQRAEVERRKADWGDAQRAAACEADGTCGSRLRSTGPVYRQLARHAEVLRNDYLRSVQRLDGLATQRTLELKGAATSGEALREAGLLARLDALHRYTMSHRTALVAWMLFFLLVASFELIVLGIKFGFGETVDDRVERMREAADEHRATEYLESLRSPMRHVHAFLRET